MYRDIHTMCWSIKQVNKNLGDRKALADYSIKYLKNACAELSAMVKEAEAKNPDEALVVMDKSGKKKTYSLTEISDMLLDARKLMELNLIDNIDKWARANMDWEVARRQKIR
jgi:hypothetical protein